MLCCPRFLTVCHINYILYGTEISGTTDEPTAFLKCELFKPCDTSMSTREHQRNNSF